MTLYEFGQGDIVSIGIFDSGLGGLSVLKGIHQLLPSHDLFYLADAAFAPYGKQPPSVILNRCEVMANFLLSKGVDLLVIACNTATSIAASTIRSYVSVPVVAMEPALKPARLQSVSKTIAVLATPHTLASQNLSDLIIGMPDIKWQLVACPGWVEAVENGEFDTPTTRSKIGAVIAPLLELGVDTLVLGCTHYPFLTPAIHELYPQLVVIDSTDGVSRRVAQLVGDYGIQKGDGIVWGGCSRVDLTYYKRMQSLGIHRIMDELF